MEFHVKSDRKQTDFIGAGLVIENEEKENLESLIANMVYGCGLIITSVIQKRTNDHDIQKKLADLSLRMLQDTVNSFLEDVHEQTLYDAMVTMYEEWFDEYCEYEDEDELIADVKKYSAMPRFVYNDEDVESIDVFLTAEEGSEKFNEFLGSIPIVQYQDNRVRAESMALAFEFIAVVLFDKAFSEQYNPLRADDWVHLDRQLPAFLETLESV